MAENTVLQPPVHVGVIMDGNGRWAKKRGLPRKFGHREGAKTFKTIARHAKALGIKYITFYAFSTENWKRPQEEVDALMELFEKYLDDVKDFVKENIRIRFIGDRSMLSQTLQDKMRDAEELSKDFSAMTLLLAINYGGRDEITRAAKKLCKEVEEGKLKADDIDIDMLSNALDTGDYPDPDLLIRTCGEQRISNFLLWQLAYSEFYFCDKPWPDFDKKELEKAIEAYNSRDRKYGGLSAKA